jgi:hypothetical protein
MGEDKKTALITVIEGNMNNINFDANKIRLYEIEALRCFRHWRKNAGNLKNIDIYCICVTNNQPSIKTINELKKLNVNYIHNYDNRSEVFTNGFWNKPLGCSILEKKLNYDFFIHIDLDMYILNELQTDIHCNSCLIYDKFDSLQERKLRNSYYIPYNTCYMTGTKNDLIFTKWFEILQNINNIDIEKYYTEVTEDKYEEAAFDILSYYTDVKIKPQSNIMFGETYTPLSMMKNVDNISFHHYHIYNKNTKQLYDYKKYEKEISNYRGY